MLKTPIEIQSIIAGIVLIATIFAVAWYMPKWGKNTQKLVPPKNKSGIDKRPLTLEEVAARSAFVRALKAVTQRLATNASGSYTISALQIFTEIYGDKEVAGSEQAKKHPIIAQAYNSLKERFGNLENKTRDFKDMVDKFTPTLSYDDIKQSCNETRNLVHEYQGLVEALMKFLGGLKQEDIKPIWESAPYSLKIHKTLADDYDRLMTLVKDLRKDTPEALCSLLPREDALSNFPRAALWG